MEQEERGSLQLRTNREQYVLITLLFFDFLLLNGLLFSFAHFFADYVPSYLLSSTKVTFLVMNMSLAISEYFYHTIIYRRMLRWIEFFYNVTKLVTLQVFLSFLMLKFLTDSVGMFKFMLVFYVCEWLLFYLLRVVCRWLLQIWRSKGGNARTVLFVGNDDSLRSLYMKLSQSVTGYHVLGYYADAPMKRPVDGFKYLGTINDLNAGMRARMCTSDPESAKGRIDDVYCSLSHDEGKQIRLLEVFCDHSLTRFFYVPRSFSEYGLPLRPVRIGDTIAYTNRFQPLLKVGNRVMKRMFDVAVSLCVCICLIPIIIVVGIIIKLQSPGPIFFRQQRTGINGKTFKVIKFRSMHVNKDADSVQATENDPRKFKFGDFMRRANIDELPQFFNVLNGDMSIVGPRPHMLRHTELYGHLINEYAVRLFCKPGITGFAQVSGFRGETKELWQMQGRVNADIWYIEHWSMGLDLRIIFKTAMQVFVHDEQAY
jgi:putative colanic acid biosynthesis UDP-glucose lipid carrier transferase